VRFLDIDCSDSFFSCFSPIIVTLWNNNCHSSTQSLCLSDCISVNAISTVTTAHTCSLLVKLCCSQALPTFVFQFWAIKFGRGCDSCISVEGCWGGGRGRGDPPSLTRVSSSCNLSVCHNSIRQVI
jgi:hypothetical protein